MACSSDCGSFFYDDILGTNGHCEVIKKKILSFKILLADNIHVSNLIENIFCIH